MPYLGISPPPLIDTDKIADNAVTAAKFNADVISAQTELAAEPADTDELLLSDAGVLKRIDYSLVKSKGKLLQVISVAVAKATFTSAIPDDDTTPTVSEGTEIYSQAITPSAASSKILITGSIEGSSSAANGWGITVFRGSTCILTVHQTNAMGGGQPCQCNINVLDSPSSTDAVTYSVRAGCMTGSSAIFVQRRGTEKYNNTMALNSVTLQEIGA